jgi:hypothetical protein
MNCSRCKEQPGFHSFEQIADVSGIQYFYCFPAHNKDSVKNREDMLNFVSHFPTEGTWSLIFHANGYGLSNMMPLTVALEMGKRVQERHRKNLMKIYIVEGSWFMNFLLTCILPFLQKDMKEKFILVPGTVLDVASFFRKEGLTLKELEKMRNNYG